MTLSIQSAANGENHEIRDAQTTPTINVTNHALDSYDEVSWPHLADIQLPNETHGPVQVLLGADVFELIMPREVVEGPPGTLCTVRTLLGWTVTGHTTQRTTVNEATEGQVHTTSATPRRHKRPAAATCAAAYTASGRPPPATRRRLSSAADSDLATDVDRRQGAGELQKRRALSRPPEKQLSLLREDQHPAAGQPRNLVPPATSAVQHRSRRRQLQRRFQPPPTLPTPCRRQRWHRASWRTSTTTTTHGTSLAFVTRGGPPVCGHSATPTAYFVFQPQSMGIFQPVW